MQHGQFKNGICKVLFVTDRNQEFELYSPNFEDAINRVVNACRGVGANVMGDGAAFYSNIKSFAAYCGDKEHHQARARG